MTRRRRTAPEASPGSRARWTWRDSAVVVSVVVAGVLVAWALPHQSPSTTTSSALSDYYVGEPAQYPVEIPGCDVVLPPTRTVEFGWAGYGPRYGYDNPKYSWFSAPKATAMSDAARAALPAGAELAYASPARTLLFDPIYDIPEDQLPEGVDQEDVGGDTTASAALSVDGIPGQLSVTVGRWEVPVPACVAGMLDRRTTAPDGTVVDTVDTWYEFGGVRTLERTATAYAPDGSRIVARATDGDFAGHSGRVPLTLGQLSTIALASGLRTTAPVPPGTPSPRPGCGEGIEPLGGPLDRATVARLNLALEDAWRTFVPADVALDRPIGSLELAEPSNGAACEVLGVTGSGGAGELSITIDTDTPAPEEFSPPRPDVTATTAPDSSRVLRHSPTAVTVARPSGTTVRIHVSGNGTALALDQLQDIATAPGLDL
ncbi:hypothetical protein [Rhodococcus sp. NPDC127528]|uniref:hypothetical protein n=1 Tax=unclassified Rhodococcus (in: high G+C Gram-positive bacteria) TaxID=192944 RepID=UPI00363687CE